MGTEIQGRLDPATGRGPAGVRATRIARARLESGPMAGPPLVRALRPGWLTAPGLLLVACSHSASLPAPHQATEAAAASNSAFASPYAYEWFIRAEVLRAHGQLAPAIAAYRAALTSADEDPYVLSRLAGALDEYGDRAAADAELNAALTLDPHSEAAWFTRAQIAERHDEVDAAVAAYERAESAAGHSAQAPLALARLLRMQGSNERAIAVLTRFEARTLPGSAGAALAALELALMRDDGAAAYAAAQAQLRAATFSRDALLRTARDLLDRGRPELAERILQALPSQPQDTPLRLRALLACGRREAAEALLTTADPAVFGGLVPTAQAYLAVQRADLALELAASALLLAPNEARAQLVNAQATLALGRYTDAAVLFAQLQAAGSAGASAQAGLMLALQAEGLAALAGEVSRERDSR